VVCLASGRQKGCCFSQPSVARYRRNTRNYASFSKSVVSLSSAARMRLKRPWPPETNLLRFSVMLKINFQLLRQNSRTQEDISDWQRHWLNPPEENFWLRYYLAQLRNKISTSLRSNNGLFQNIDWEFLDVPLDDVVWQKKAIANLLATASLHVILAIFTAAGLTKLSAAIYCRTLLLLHFSKQQKRHALLYCGSKPLLLKWL